MVGAETVAALDLGTTKVSVLVAEVERDLWPKLLGIGVVSAAGIRQGQVVDLPGATHSIRQAVQDAELMAGIKITRVVVGISGEQIQNFHSRSVVSVGTPRLRQEVSPADVGRVLAAARLLEFPSDRQVLHVLPTRFAIDDQDGIRQPAGMVGVRLSADVQVVTCGRTATENLLRAVGKTELEVSELVAEPLAASRAVLTPEEKETGVALIDLGGSTTQLAVFLEDALALTACIPLGGRNATNDLAVGLRLPGDKAEELKLIHGAAYAPAVDPDEVVLIPATGSRPPKQISRTVLASIIQPRLEEIFGLLARQIRRKSYAEPVPASVVLTGGGALLAGVCHLAEHCFDLPVRIGIPQGFTGLVERAAHPRHATGVGLVLYGAASPRQNGHRPPHWERTVRKLTRVWREYFQP